MAKGCSNGLELMFNGDQSSKLKFFLGRKIDCNEMETGKYSLAYQLRIMIIYNFTAQKNKVILVKCLKINLTSA